MKIVYQFGQNMDEDTMKDIEENINNILGIPENSIPLSRGLGMSWRTLSEIPPDLENDFAVEAVEKIEKYETRVAVDQITFEHDEVTGETQTKIIFEGGDEDE